MATAPVSFPLARAVGAHSEQPGAGERFAAGSARETETALHAVMSGPEVSASSKRSTSWGPSWRRSCPPCSGVSRSGTERSETQTRRAESIVSG